MVVEVVVEVEKEVVKDGEDGDENEKQLQNEGKIEAFFDVGLCMAQEDVLQQISKFKLYQYKVIL